MSTQQRARVAVVDDEVLILESWREALNDHYDVHTFSDPLAARKFFEEYAVDLALLDLLMPGMDGVTLMQHLQARQPDAEAIMISGHGTIETAVQAVHQGAYDFLPKPVEDLDAALNRIASAIERKRLRELNASLQTRLAAYNPSTELIGHSRVIEEMRNFIGQVAPSAAPVLIDGESGTGKELVARALHSNSDRAEKPFVAINCGALGENLIDSELFGHERGAFTGAVSSHKGLFEAAHGGVLFLDEIGEIPLPTQVRLLRALQENEIRPVGSVKSRKVDVRVVAATNADLERAMRQGTFREDLYYRICTFRIQLPPLRERTEDVPLIAQHLLRRFVQRSGKKIDGFSEEALSCLMSHHWPGNVRELDNVVEHAATLVSGERIEPHDLPSYLTANTRNRAPAANQSMAALGTIESLCSVPYTEARTRVLDDFERRYLEDLMTFTSGNISQAARQSGIDRSNLRRMLRRHDLDAGAFKSRA